MRELLRRVPDLERALSRLALDRGGPRDLAAVRDALAQAGRLRAALPEELPEVLTAARAALAGQEALLGLLDAGAGRRAAASRARRRLRGAGP